MPLLVVGVRMGRRTIGAGVFAQARQALAGEAAWLRADELLGGSSRPDPSLLRAEPEPRADFDDSAALIYHLTYIDAGGDESVRIVTLRRIDPDRNGLKLLCWCHAAGALRHFRVDRIRQVFCIVTGEVFDEAESYFLDHPMLTAPGDPEAYALSVCRHEVSVLTILAAADGRFDPGEQERILVHVYDRCAHLDLDEGLLRRRLAKLAPDVAAFEAAMIRMGRFGSGDPIALRRSMRKLVDADGRIAPEEVEFVAEVEARLAGVIASAS